MEKLTAQGGSRGRLFRFCACFVPILALCSGCGNKFFDPAQVGRFRPVPAVNVILDSLGVAEEAPVAWEGAEEPLPVDTVVTEADYALRSGDVVGVSIYELLREGAYHTNNYVVTETGKISIPEVGVVQAAGLSETQLEEQIKRTLAPNILKNPTVTATLVTSEQRAFSVLGDGVQFPGRYLLPRYAFRLTDALATAGSPRQFNVSYIYVSRVTDDGSTSPGPVNPGFGELELKVIEPETTRPDLRRQNTSAPRAQYQWPRSNVVIASSEMITSGEARAFTSPTGQWDSRAPRRVYASNAGNESGQTAVRQRTDEPISVDDILKTLSQRTRSEQGTEEQTPRQDALQPSPRPAPTGTGALGQDAAVDVEWVFQDGKWVRVEVGGRKPAAEEEPTGHIEWIFQNGKWVPIQVGPAAPTEPVIEIEPGQKLPAPPEPRVPAPGWEQEGAKTRLIRIPADKLLAGDPRYNIVIKPGDSIFVPVDIIGEFCIMGNVNRTGYIPLTGRPMTLKQAIAAAGGLGPLAWPKRCEVIRRIGKKKEEIVMVDLDKIASGEEPDFFIKPHDLINVGTHATSRWRAILRNAFRATYGFGFVYDRNFADRDFYTHRPIPDWF
ncbi:MAG: polysaccharide biosynthesis/export family protein [Phycisphaerales bacterium]|nr:MAG: polysaccharide biosynthesis/export family protein [Phycisphaerales bacterium]